MNKKNILTKKKSKLLAAEKAKLRSWNYLNREQAYGKRTITLCEARWKQILEKISNRRLKEYLVFTWNNFERIIDYKEVEISLYMDWVELDEDHRRKSQYHHTERIDDLINFYKESCESFLKEAEEKVENLKMVWSTVMDTTSQNASQELEYLDTMRYHIEQSGKQDEHERITNYFSIINEGATKFQHILNVLEAQLTVKMERLYTNIHKVMDDFFESVESRKKLVADVHSRESELHKDVERNTRKLAKLTKVIHLLNQKLHSMYDKEGSFLDCLIREKERLYGNFLLLREKLVLDIKNDSSKLQTSITNSNESYERLRRLDEEGTKMLKYLRSCRKYETLLEKVLPYPIYPESHVLEENLKNVSVDDISDERTQSMDKLNLFWSKMAIANASRYTLNEERVFLKLENKRLRREIHRHCQCLDCPSLPPIPTRAGKIPLTEGNVMMEKLKKTSNKSIQRETEIDEEVDETKIDSKNEIESVSLLFGSTFLARI